MVSESFGSFGFLHTAGLSLYVLDHFNLILGDQNLQRV